MSTPLTFESLEKSMCEQQAIEAAQPVLIFRCRQDVMSLAIANNLNWETIADMERRDKLVYNPAVAPGQCLKVIPYDDAGRWRL